MSAREPDIIASARGGGMAGARKPRSIRSYPSESDDDVSESSNEHVSEVSEYKQAFHTAQSARSDHLVEPRLYGVG